MPIDILMPALSPTMEAGTLAKWLVKAGDTVKSGQVMAEIETDKATMEFEAVDEGVIGAIIVAEGAEDVKVGTKIATLLVEEDGQNPSPQPSPARGEGAAVAEKPSPPAGEGGAERRVRGAEADRVKASPLARRIAADKGIDLSALAGTGPGGRIVKADVLGGAPAVSAPAAAAIRPAAPASDFTPPADVPFEEIKLPGMRKVIAKRMAESKSTVPHFYLTVDVELDALMASRKALNTALEKQGVKLSVNDFIIRACGLTLKKVPDANAMFAGDKMYRFQRADISVAVAVPGGLVTPVIRGACSKGLADISTEMKALADKARDGKLMPEDYQGGTFSISNLGMMGIKQFEAVINPPQGAILAVGAGEQRAVVRNGAIAIATVMSVTLSVDHRVLDGAIGAAFLAEFKRLIEEPLLMLA